VNGDVAPPLAAPQQSRGPRPLPLFLSLVARTAERDPDLARAALEGVRRYQHAPEPTARRQRPVAAEAGGARLLDCGGSGAPIILVPSLINPPHILDLDEERSLAGALSGAGRIFLLDWGPAAVRRDFDLVAHVTQLLLPLVDSVGPARLVGYCLGGALALLAGRLSPTVVSVATLAAPWRFSAYPAEARQTLAALWSAHRQACEGLGFLPMEVLQSAFWSLDPERVVGKFARFARLDPQSEEARRFVLLEEWANGGEPLPLAAARELVEELFGNDRSGRGEWGKGLPSCPTLHVTAANDRIVPAASAAPGPTLACPAGHVGMIAGRRAPETLHRPLRQWLEGEGAGS
jgi:polyhydroxyalkanoate synthase subunit PhaC